MPSPLEAEVEGKKRFSEAAQAAFAAEDKLIRILKDEALLK